MLLRGRETRVFETVDVKERLEDLLNTWYEEDASPSETADAVYNFVRENLAEFDSGSGLEVTE